jgi:hypothetical protein
LYPMTGSQSTGIKGQSSVVVSDQIAYAGLRA